MTTQTFTDFEAFAAALCDADYRVMLTRRGPPRWRISHFELGRVRVQLGSSDSGVICEGAARRGGSVLYVPLRGAAGVTWNGRRLDDRSVAVLGPGAEYFVASAAGNDWLSLFIPSDLLTADPSGAADRRPVGEPDGHVGRLRALVVRIAAAARDRPDALTAPAAAVAAQSELVSAARQVMRAAEGVAPAAPGRPAVPRERIIARAAERLEARAGDRVSVGDLAAAAGVSQRTLRTAFQDYLGVGPVRYMRLRQLHRVRGGLRAADPAATTVTAVASQYGFWELGRFARDYRALFGEPPSETLRRPGPTVRHDPSAASR
jgi:AraC family ethanolamine operon transcriptional activator